jgi:hypothetical protein
MTVPIWKPSVVLVIVVKKTPENNGIIFSKINIHIIGK